MNILIKIKRDDNTTQLVYLNNKGIEKLNKKLSESPFFDMINKKIIIQEWFAKLAYNFSQSGDYNAQSNYYCQYLNLVIMNYENNDFNKTYELWSKNFKILVGQNGLEEVSLNSKLVEVFLAENTINLYQENDFHLFINFVQKQKLNQQLEFSLEKKLIKIKNKI